MTQRRPETRRLVLTHPLVRLSAHFHNRNFKIPNFKSTARTTAKPPGRARTFASSPRKSRPGKPGLHYVLRKEGAKGNIYSDGGARTRNCPSLGGSVRCGRFRARNVTENRINHDAAARPMRQQRCFLGVLGEERLARVQLARAAGPAEKYSHTEFVKIRRTRFKPE